MPIFASGIARTFDQRLGSHQPKPSLVWLAAAAAALLVAGCNKPTESAPTPGQQLDAAIAKTGDAAQEVKRKAEESAAKAKASTEQTFAQAGEQLKKATQQAETSAKEVTGKALATMDDVAISTAISAELAKDSEFRAFQVKVDTKGGAVTLKGTAPNEAAKERATKLTRAFSGVVSVDNKLAIKP